MLHGFVEILADGTTRHHVAQYRIHLHLHICLDGGDFFSRLIAFQNTTVATYEELGEVPLDVTLLVKISIIQEVCLLLPVDLRIIVKNPKA